MKLFLIPAIPASYDGMIWNSYEYKSVLYLQSLEYFTALLCYL